MQSRRFLPCFACLVMLAPLSNLHGQTLPQAGRTVFRCESEGKVTYSDAACKGAQKVEIEPTRGLSTTGRERPGADVQKERREAMVDEALQPLADMGNEEMNVVRRRQRLPPAARAECGRLDQRIAGLERRESIAPAGALVAVQDELLIQRTRYRELRC